MVFAFFDRRQFEQNLIVVSVFIGTLLLAWAIIKFGVAKSNAVGDSENQSFFKFKRQNYVRAWCKPIPPCQRELRDNYHCK